MIDAHVTAPAGRSVRIWTMATPPPSEAVLARWHALLDAEERQQAARFVFARNRHEYVGAHALTRLLLSSLARAEGGRAVAPAAWRFARGPGTKPRLVGPDAGVPLAFSLSHTAGRVAVAAVPDDLALGVDNEAVSRQVDPGLAARYFTAGEVAWLNAQPPASRVGAFLRLWTLKEAYLKALGDGLEAGLDSIGFDVTGPVPRVVMGRATGQAWRFGQWTLDPDPHADPGADPHADGADVGHVLAVACYGLESEPRLGHERGPEAGPGGPAGQDEQAGSPSEPCRLAPWTAPWPAD